MKKIYLLFTVNILTFMLLITPSTLQAVDFDVGLYSFYAFWEPSFSGDVKDLELDPMLMWGPYLSVTFCKKLSVSAVLIQNRTNPSELEYVDVGNGDSGEWKINCEAPAWRSDLDLSVSYRFTGGLSLIAGYKISRFGEDEDNSSAMDSGSPYTIDDYFGSRYFDCYLHGFALGGAYSVPLFNFFSLSINTVAIVCSCNLTYSTFIEAIPGSIGFGPDADEDCIGIGNNTSLGLSYYIEPLGTSIILGGRFQFIRYFSESDTQAFTNEYFYGVTLAAVLHI